MDILNKTSIKNIKKDDNVKLPPQGWMSLPEKVLQFGTGVLLRGLPDYFIDKANREGLFNGRVLVVKSTDRGGTDEFQDQDNLYTLYVKGIENSKTVEESIVISAISRVLSASSEWEEISSAALSPDMKIVISNTTEVGIVLDEDDDLNAFPPKTFPGKLTSLLHKRFLHFKGEKDKGWIILPTELVSENGEKLRNIVLQLAEINKLGEDFITWVNQSNDFCNTLVDRIVPGKLPSKEKEIAQAESGYRDELAIMAEPFRLWAIEAKNEYVRQVLSFSQVDKGLVIAPNIWKFKELKLRLLNGAHTFSCALALMSGFDTVKEAMRNQDFLQFINRLMQSEIVPTISGNEIGEKEVLDFAASVIDRFSNPFLNHQWKSISLNYTSKMEQRNVPLFVEYERKMKATPKYMALGFAAFLLFVKDMDKEYKGSDVEAPYFADLWTKFQPNDYIDQVMKNETLWKKNLNAIPGFQDTVKHYVQLLMNNHALEVIKQVNAE